MSSQASSSPNGESREVPKRLGFGLGPLVFVALLGAVGCASEVGGTEASVDDLEAAGNADTLGADYKRLSAEKKEERLWGRISAKPNATPTDWPNGPLTILARLNSLDLDVTGDRRSDELPQGRVKLLHARGTVVKVEWVAATDTPYTGVFKGARGVARFSLATNPEGQGSKNYVPGLGLKFFVDGRRSKNMQAMFSIDGQGDEADLFAHEFSNVIPAPGAFGTGLIGDIFERVSASPSNLAVAQLAAFERNGKVVPEPKAPEQIWFVPSSTVHTVYKATGADFRVDLAKIPSGTVLYTIESTVQGKRKAIGTLVTRSEMVASEYGDQKLFFKHSFTNRTHFDPQAADRDE